MTEQEFKELKPGDMVMHVNRRLIFLVAANYGDRVTAVRTEDLTNPDEWIGPSEIR